MPADPLPPTIAARWRPMWHPWAHIIRPWWRVSRDTPRNLERVDGWSVYDGSMGVSVQPPGNGPTKELPAGTRLADAMAYVDTNHPLPAPDPMPGQVWVSAAGTECMIAAAWRDGGSWWVQWASNPDVPALWQPPTSVLVAGPTPWGRDVPWAPMGGGAS